MLKSNYQTKQVKFNQEIHGRKKGTIEPVRVDENGILLDAQLRRRFKDNDNCVVFVDEKGMEIVAKKPTQVIKKNVNSEKPNVNNKGNK